mmetsp:Transcript_22133/g.28279  ORF Transcript_22133/g.28279 Transcript_22133/m.28279 type:complete len:80 (-) Transcript_22133:471-710(-)
MRTSEKPKCRGSKARTNGRVQKYELACIEPNPKRQIKVMTVNLGNFETMKNNPINETLEIMKNPPIEERSRSTSSEPSS